MLTHYSAYPFPKPFLDLISGSYVLFQFCTHFVSQELQITKQRRTLVAFAICLLSLAVLLGYIRGKPGNEAAYCASAAGCARTPLDSDHVRRLFLASFPGFTRAISDWSEYERTGKAWERG